MRKKRTYTSEERSMLIKKYKESGLSMVSWCKENDMPYSTFCKWNLNSKKKQEFIELKQADIQKETQKEDLENPFSEILIEAGSLKIHVPVKEGLNLIEKLMKEGGCSNV